MMNQIGRAFRLAFWLIYSVALLQGSFDTVHVWDIATKTWFAQSTTTGGHSPDILKQNSCFVVASAEDNSSHNIYLYQWGWGEGVSRVFILTLPTFRWVLVYESSEDGVEGGGGCLKVHEKHMVLYRGWPYIPDNYDNLDNPEAKVCDYGKDSKRFQGMQIYDMSSLTWTTKVELKNQKYLVPELLYNIIGGK